MVRDVRRDQEWQLQPPPSAAAQRNDASRTLADSGLHFPQELELLPELITPEDPLHFELRRERALEMQYVLAAFRKEAVQKELVEWKQTTDLRVKRGASTLRNVSYWGKQMRRILEVDRKER